MLSVLPESTVTRDQEGYSSNPVPEMESERGRPVPRGRPGFRQAMGGRLGREHPAVRLGRRARRHHLHGHHDTTLRFAAAQGEEVQAKQHRHPTPPLAAQGDGATRLDPRAGVCSRRCRRCLAGVSKVHHAQRGRGHTPIHSRYER